MRRISDNQHTNSLNHYQELHSYLQTRMELIIPEAQHPAKGPQKATQVKITASNAAPFSPDGPAIVFVGVTLCVGHIGGDIQTIKPNVIKQEKTELFQTVPEIKYNCISRQNIPDIFAAEKQQGELLFPGESIAYEMYVPSQMIPYLQFRVEGSISQRYLSHCQNTIVMPEEYTKPIAMAAIKSFNDVGIHEVLGSVINAMPIFNNETHLAEVQVFASLLSLKMREIKKTQDTLNALYKQHKIFWFHLHLKSTFAYLEHLKTALLDMKDALALNEPSEIANKVTAIMSLKAEARQLNRATESLIEKNNLSDAEVDYKYRAD